MSDNHYVVRPKAVQDLDEAYYYASASTPELGHRFLPAAYDTFALLASSLGDSPPRHKERNRRRSALL